MDDTLFDWDNVIVLVDSISVDDAKDGAIAADFDDEAVVLCWCGVDNNNNNEKQSRGFCCLIFLGGGGLQLSGNIR